MPNRTTLTEAEIAFAKTQRVARLATADAGGHPHVVPVCYAFDGMRFYCDGYATSKHVTRHHS